MNDGMSSVARNAAREVAHVMPEPFPGAVVAGFDVHLRQITFDAVDSLTGEVTRADRVDACGCVGVGRGVPRS